MRGEAVLYSAGMHLAILLFAIWGLPSLFDDEPELKHVVITLEPLPIKERTNVKPSKAPITKAKEKPKKDKPKPAETKRATPEPVPEKKENPVKAPVPEKKVVKKEKPKPEPKKEKPKPEKKKKTKKKPENKDALDDILKDIRKAAQQQGDGKEKKATPKTNTTKSDALYDPSLPLSISEIDAIASQVYRCWRVPAGVANAHELIILLQVKLKRDGTVYDVKLAEDKGRYRNDPVFRAATDSAIRAVQMCGRPFKNLPQDKYNRWKDFKMRFNPRDMLY